MSEIDRNTWSKVGNGVLDKYDIMEALYLLRKRVDAESIHGGSVANIAYDNLKKIEGFYNRNHSRIWAIRIAMAVAELNDSKLIDCHYKYKDTEHYEFSGSGVDGVVSLGMFVFLMGQLSATYEKYKTNKGLDDGETENKFFNEISNELVFGINEIIEARRESLTCY